MFDIAFSELLLISVVALIVIGPERLPGVARTLGHLFGRMQRYVNDVKADIQREMDLDELKKLRQSVEDSAHSIEQSVKQEFNAAEQELRGLESLGGAGTEPAASTAVPETAAAGAEPNAPETPPEVGPLKNVQPEHTGHKLQQ